MLAIKLKDNLMCLPVISFNSGKYEINANKTKFFSVLEKGVVIKPCKKGNKYMSIKTDRLQFLEICNYLAPNYYYDSFLAAYGARLRKGYFPYEWFDSFEKLKETKLPSIECFYSKLQNTSISLEEYLVCIEA